MKVKRSSVFSKITYVLMVLILLQNVFVPTLAGAAVDSPDYITTIADETWTNEEIEQDVYIGPNSQVTIDGKVEITGDVYVYGMLTSLGDLNINGTLHVKKYSNSESFEPGSAQFLEGKNHADRINITNRPYDIPFEISSENLSNKNNPIQIEGKTLPFLEVYVQGEEVSLNDNGEFKASVINVTTNQVQFEIKDVFGNTIHKAVEIEDVIEPGKVADFKVVENDGYSVEVIWSAANDADVENYHLFANGEKVEEVAADETAYTFTNLEEDTTYTLSIAAVDYSNNVSKKSTVETRTNINAPTVNSVSDQDTEITGKASPESTIKVSTNGKEIASGKTATDGKFEIAISKQVAGTTLSVIAIGKNGTESEATTITVADTTAPSAPIVNDLLDKSTTLSGKAEAGATVTAKVSNKEIGKATAKSDGTFEMEIEKQAAGTEISVTATDKAGNESKATQVVVKPQLDRISGYMRYDTAIEVSKRGWNSADTVILARGDNFADALAGVPLAHKLDAPILMTPVNKLWDNTLTEIHRLGTKNVIILGGKGAVSDAVVNKLVNEGLNVRRIAGSSRFETAALIANEVAPSGTEKVVVANGMDFPDALSVASHAAKEGLPILLTMEDRLPAATEAKIKQFDVKETIVVGGKSVVSEKVVAQLPDTTRLSGSDRYKTNIEIAKHFGVNSKHLYVATGQNYADALTGAVLAAKDDSTIVLVHHRVPAAASDYMKKQTFDSLSIFGGTGAVSKEIETALKNLLP